MSIDKDRARTAVRERDSALARIGRTRRWLLGAVAALSAGIAGLAAIVAPGRSLAAHPTAETPTASQSTSTATGSSADQLPAPASASALGLQSPGAAPQAVTTTSNPPQSNPAPSNPAPSNPAPAVAPASSGGGGAVVSGGS